MVRAPRTVIALVVALCAAGASAEEPCCKTPVTGVCPARAANKAAEQALEDEGIKLNHTQTADDAAIAVAQRKNLDADSKFQNAMADTAAGQLKLSVDEANFNNAVNEYMRIVSQCNQPQPPTGCQGEGGKVAVAKAHMHSYNATLHSSQEALAQDQAVQATANQKLNLTSIGYVNAIAKKNADIVQINNEMQSLSDAKIAAADKLDKATLACPGLCTCPAVLEVSAGSACTTGTPVAIAGKTYGTKYTILKQGSGVAVATPKTEVSALVVGTLESGKVFWNSSNPLAGPHGTAREASWFTFTYELPPSGLIVGFDVGVHGMKTGEVRELCIPADEGYGKAGRPPAIPADSTLVFTLTCEKIGK